MAPAPPSPDTDLPKTVGRYEVIRLIGEGAMGRVLLAHDPVLGRDVAVKLLRDDLRVPRDVRQGLIVRMRHEARAAARVAHPNLVTLHDMGEDDQQGLYLVFEYVEGPTLKQQLAKGRLAPDQAAPLARDLGRALTVAHQAGVLHRDIKPDNVILAATGGKIADFGIAKIPDSTLTQTGGLMGTPAYSAPETLRGSHFSAESDQFSLAASLYEAVSGERAFKGEDAMEVAMRISHDPPSPIAQSFDLPPAVDAIFARAMAKDPSQRFPSCEAFGEALATTLQQAERAGQPQGQAIAGSARSLLAPAALSAGQPEGDALGPERKTSHVLLGAAVVIVTAALLVRTALRSVQGKEDDAPLPPEPSAAPAASEVPKPKVVLPSIRPKPNTDTDTGAPSHDTAAEAASATQPEEPPDAAADEAVDAQAAEPASSAQPAVPAASSSAGGKVIDAGP